LTDPKTRWPRGFASAGLFFANAKGLELLRGEGTPQRIELLEGLADTLARSLQLDHQPVAVLGLTQGSPPGLAQVAWPAGVPIIAVTHSDRAGEALAQASRRMIPPHIDVLRANMAKLVPEDALGRL
jgi:hypothetical protein